MEEQRKPRSQIKILEDLKLPREQLEENLISLLQLVYENDESKVNEHLLFMERVNNNREIRVTFN